MTALLLVVLVPLKIWSGYVFVGRAPGPRALAALHVNPVIDGLLLFAVIFHVLFGIRVMLIDFGLARYGDLLFRTFLLLGAALFIGVLLVIQ